MRTYQRWSVDGWSWLLEVLAMRSPERWTEGKRKRERELSKRPNPTGSLYERYSTIWEALRWVDKHGALKPSSPLAREIDGDEVARLRKSAEALKFQGC